MNKATQDRILTSDSEKFEEIFPIVNIEDISLQDPFMQYEPETFWEKELKNSMIMAKKMGMKNFRKPCIDPSFADNGETIIYRVGEKPAVGKTVKWWKRKVPDFMPEKNSRILYDIEKYVSLGIIIRNLVEEEEYMIRDAWKIVCFNSKDIAHYRDSKDAKKYLEMTGSRAVGKWCDLGNTCKIVERYKKGGFAIFGGPYYCYGEQYPLANSGMVTSIDGVYVTSIVEIRLDV